MPPDIDLLLTSNPRDEDFVRRIADRVRERDFIPWMDRDAPPDDPAAAVTAPAVAVCLGRRPPREPLAPWERPAVRDCIQRMMKEGLPVVPVLLPGGPEEPDAELFPTLRDDAWVDFRAGLDPDEIELLIWLAFGLQPSRRRREQTSKPPDLSPEALDRLDPTAATILRLAAFLAPAPIPIELFEEGETIVRQAAGLLQEEEAPTSLFRSVLQSFGVSPRREDPEPVLWAFADLADGSFLVGREERTFTVPPEVLEIVRSRIPDGERRWWVEQAARLVNQPNFFITDRRSTPVFLLHLAAVDEHAESAGLPHWSSKLRPFLGASLETEGRMEEAEALLRRSLDLDTAAPGATHQDIIEDLLALADLLEDTGRSAEAEPLLHQAVEHAEAFGQTAPMRARALDHLGMLLLNLRRPAEAEHWLQRSVKIQEGMAVLEPGSLRSSLRLLATAILESDELGDRYKTAAEAGEDDDGEDNKNSETVEDPLEEAERLLARALALADDCSSPNDTEAVYCRCVQAEVERAWGDLKAAEAQMSACVDVLERTEGPDARATRIYRKKLEWIRRELSEEQEPLTGNQSS
jgi:tetratricopeptide (TPR) repeat protein